MKIKNNLLCNYILLILSLLSALALIFVIIIKLSQALQSEDRIIGNILRTISLYIPIMCVSSISIGLSVSTIKEMTVDTVIKLDKKNAAKCILYNIFKGYTIKIKGKRKKIKI